MRLQLGEALKSEEERPLQKDRTAHLKLLSSSATKDLLSSAPENQKPIALTFEKAGNYLLAMERKASTIKLDSVKFEEYLAEHGLDFIIIERKRRGEAEREGTGDTHSISKLYYKSARPRTKHLGSKPNTLLKSHRCPTRIN